MDKSVKSEIITKLKYNIRKQNMFVFVVTYEFIVQIEYDGIFLIT